MARTILDQRRDRMRPVRYAVLGLVLVALLFGHSIVRLLTDWQWFGELGQRQVFATELSAKLTLYFGFGILFFIICYANLWYARHRSEADPRPRLLDPEHEQFVRLAASAARWGTIVVAVVLAFSVGASAATHWSEYLLFTHAERFGQADPVFGRDIGFYVFTLPFLNYLQGLLLFTLFVATIGTAGMYYALRGADFMVGRAPVLPTYARRHLLALAAGLAIALAWREMLSRYDLLYADNGYFVGAGYTDLHARLPAITIQAIAWVIVGGLCIANMSRGRPFVLPAVGLGAWVVVSILASGVWPSVMQRFEVVPNQLGKDGAYIQRNLELTRRAYGLDNVRTEPIEAAAPLTTADLAQNKATIDNIRLWDWPQLGAIYDAKEALSTYYRFTLPPAASRYTDDYNIDVDRYQINGISRQVMVGVRELLTDALPQQAKTWQNLSLVYTHGYGVVMSPVNVINEQGLPEYFVSKVPVRSAIPGITVDRPQVYYGERTTNPVFVEARQSEFDHPGETGKQETRYQGSGGVLLGGYLNRLLWSARLGDVNLLLSSDVTSQSRVLFWRGIRERVGKLAPMLNWDNDPYMVLDRGKLVWMMDAYTVTDQYPYSYPTALGTGAEGIYQRFNYIRNAVKAVVDAYDGTVKLYVFDTQDPMLRAYRRIFPHLFIPGEQMPPALRAHIRYPEDLFRVQRDVYATYHVEDPQVYYGKEDQWEVPTDPSVDEDQGALGTAARRMVPYYLNMRLPGGKAEEFLLMTPFTPMARQNQLSGWMCAKCDPEDYGKLVVYRFPKGSVVNSPSQIMNMIQGIGEISKEITLLNQQGSRVIWGNLLAIPIERSLLYAVPLYVQATGATPIPTVYQVIVANGNRVVMRPRLAAAIAALPEAVPGQATAGGGGVAAPSTGRSTETGPPGSTPLVPSPSAPASPAELVRRASAALERARVKQREYDQVLGDLGRNLQQLEKAVTAPKP